ncbi:MAG: hypothetical protein PVG39_04795 [Desulfobacteraceae bacterium]|jgi:hypothetical protein
MNAIDIIDYTIVVSICTIMYSIVLIVVRAKKIVTRINKGEEAFMNSPYFKEKKREAERLGSANKKG